MAPAAGSHSCRGAARILGGRVLPVPMLTRLVAIVLVTTGVGLGLRLI